MVFYCRSGNRSAMAAEAFREAGYDAHNLAGGITAWVDARTPLEPADGVGRGRRGRPDADPRTRRRKPPSAAARRHSPPSADARARRPASSRPRAATDRTSARRPARLARPARPQARDPHLRARRRHRAGARRRHRRRSCSRSASRTTARPRPTSTSSATRSPASRSRVAGRRGGRRRAQRPRRRQLEAQVQTLRSDQTHDRPGDLGRPGRHRGPAHRHLGPRDVDAGRLGGAGRRPGDRLAAPATSRASARPWSGALTERRRRRAGRRRPRRAASRGSSSASRIVVQPRRATVPSASAAGLARPRRARSLARARPRGPPPSS